MLGAPERRWQSPNTSAGTSSGAGMWSGESQEGCTWLGWSEQEELLREKQGGRGRALPARPPVGQAPLGTWTGGRPSWPPAWAPLCTPGFLHLTPDQAYFGKEIETARSILKIPWVQHPLELP